jgi:branched-chain amino acid transport system substrate-binding protein
MKPLVITLMTFVTVTMPLLSGSLRAESVPAVDSGVIRVGVMAPLTGDYASAGEEIRRGITLAEEQLAKEKIDVKVTFENACLPAQGVSALRKMVDRDRIDAVASNYCVITLNAIRPIIEKLHLITFQNSSVATELIQSSPFIFSTWPSIEQEVDAIAQAAGDTNLRLSGLIFLESPWGLGYANAFRQVLSKRGLTPTVDASQAFDVHDFRSEVTRLKATKSTTIMAAHTGAVMVSLLKQAHAMNISGAHIFVPSDNDDQEIVNAAGPAAEGVSLFSTEGPNSNPVRTLYQEQYEKRYVRKPDPLGRHAYDELILLGRSMHVCKKEIACTQARIRSTRDFEGASGVFSMTSNGLPDRSLYRKQVKEGTFRF